MDEGEKRKIVRDAAVGRDGRLRLACAAAFRLSRETGLSIKEIGNICEQDGIKITACQLGCF